MKKIVLILLSLTLICGLVGCGNKDTKETKKAKTKKTEQKALEKVLPLQYPKGTDPSKYSTKIMTAGTVTENPEDIKAKYDYLVKKDFEILNKFGINLQDIATCCAVEKITGCYLNYAAGTKWKNATDFKKNWVAALKALPKNFYTLVNDPDIPFDTKLKTINKYGYLAYPFVNDIYTCEFYGCNSVNLVSSYHMEYTLTDEESKLLNHYFEGYNVDYDTADLIKSYLSNYIKFNEQPDITIN